jgi:LmbE family N-acetylglucosaminyl deacetylase
MNKKVIVFAPHPDDETLGCGGTIAKKTSEGYEVFVVIITDGRHAFSKVLGINSDPNPEEIKQIRKEEVIKATRILGVPITNLLFLDFEDRTLEKHEKEAEEKIIEILGFDYQTINKLSLNARKSVEKKFSKHTHLKNLLAIYND